MKNITILFFFSFFAFNYSYGQENNSNIEKQKLIESYQTEISSIKNEIKDLNERIYILKSEAQEENNNAIDKLNSTKKKKEDELNKIMQEITFLIED